MPPVLRGVCALAACWLCTTVQADAPKPQVVLLHGLARTASAMQPMADALAAHGYEVCNIDYPSREHTVEALASGFVAPAILACFPDRRLPLHFVTHSMGGIVVRQLAASGAVAPIARVVMLSPPNHGSEVVDTLGQWPWSRGAFRAINGPAGGQLGTAADALPQRLGPAPFELGIITGTRSINLLLSLLVRGEDDGKVSVASARLDGMRDFLTVPASHPFIMRDERVMAQALHFLRHGRFLHAPPSPP